MKTVRKSRVLIFILMALTISCATPDNKEVVEEKAILELARKNYGIMLGLLDNSSMNPRNTDENEEIYKVASKDWTSGFFPGALWYLYEFSGDERLLEEADHYTQNVRDQQFNGKTHDMGFKMYCSYGNGYRLTGNPEYRKILLQSAQTLITRFSPEVGCIRSWDHNTDKWQFPVIIDNMMNLELLFWASKETRDSSFYNIAVSHANNTMKNHFRQDNSSFHVVDYDKYSGEVLHKHTHQGYSHESSWARGQAWGLYGFTMCYRETSDERFLNQAIKIAEFILNHENLPDDGVPYWDFDDPKIPDTFRDVSAAAIICSALYELSMYTGQKAEEYKTFADKIFASLSSVDYINPNARQNGFILEHSVGNMPKNGEVDTPIIYADYYFIEAALRKIKLEGMNGEKKPVVILKLDDLVYDRETVVHPSWQRVADLSEEKDVDLTIGIITRSLEEGDEEFFNWIKTRKNKGKIEFWNHGYMHKRFDKDGEKVCDFRGSGYDFQYSKFKKSQDLANEKLGFTFHTFGAPYNQTDSNTIKVLNDFSEIKVWFYGNEDTPERSDLMNLKRIPALNIEYPVHQPRFYDLWNNLYFHRKEPYMVIQGHPKSWDDKRFVEFERIIDFLKGNGYSFTTAFGYYENFFRDTTL